MEFLSIWGALGLLVLFVVYLGYHRSKTGYLIFILMIGLVVIFARHLEAIILEPFTLLLEKAEHTTEHLHIALIIFLSAVFILARILRYISNIFRSEKPEESQRKQRKRVLKNYGLKSILDIRKLP